jgi:superfamily II DNA or RNA helicase
MAMSWQPDEEEIRIMYGKRDFERGMNYYRAGKVSQLRETEDPGGFECIVTGTRPYKVTFAKDEEGELEESCTCPQYAAAGACKHQVAALLAYRKYVQGRSRSRSDLRAKRVLSAYMSRGSAIRSEEGSLARLCACIRTDQRFRNFPDLEFSVGREKLYVVRDIGTFLGCVQEGAIKALGKNVTLDHGIHNFDEDSRELIRMLMNEFPQYKNGRGGYNEYSYRIWTIREKNRICIGGDAFDRLFDFLLTRPGMLRSDSAQPYQGDPQLKLSLHEDSGCAVLTPETEERWRFFTTNRNLYAASKGKVLRCSEEYRDKLSPLLEEGLDALRIDLRELPSFCSCVLPELRDLVEIRDPDGMLEECLPDECSPCLYLDMERDALYLTVRFRYGELLVSAGAPTAATPSIKRDMWTEQQTLDRAALCFPQVEGKYCIVGEDRALNFLTEQLQCLYRLGEVYISERLRGKRIRDSRAAIGVSLSDGMLELKLDTGEFPPEELKALYQSLILHKKYHRLADGRYLELNGSSYEKVAEVAQMLQLSDKDLEKGKIRLPAFRSLYLDKVLSDSEGVQVTRDGQFRAMIRNFKSVTESDYALSDSLEKIMRPYQKTGFRWLKTLESCNFGGILADEMGLGKTLETIAFFSSLDRKALGCPSLVVCPASLILNWGDEVKRFAPGLDCALIYGTAAERREIRSEAVGADLWITSYELLRQDIEEYAGQPFYCCVLDEAQHIKNAATLASKAVKRINCRQRFVLTGTPIENRLGELWNLFDFLMPGYLYTHNAFREKLEKPVVKSKNPQAAEQLRRMVQPFMLRRLKKDVLKELPPKIEYLRHVPLSEEERKVYHAACLAARESVIEGEGKMQILAALTRLRQICCDPALCYENYEGAGSKLDACLELCAGMVENGHQILLFSQFTGMLDRIRERLDDLHIHSFTLQGSTPKETRARLVREFNAGKASVFLISLKAGGTGLNLTAADVVIHYDPWWNMAAQNQATDRAHRIGQQAVVQVYKLIAKDTIEESILKLQNKKAELLETVSGNSDDSILSMSKEDLLALLD